MNIIQKFKNEQDNIMINQKKAMQEVDVDNISFDENLMNNLNAGAEKTLNNLTNNNSINTAFLNFNYNNNSDMINNINTLRNDIDFASKKWGVSPNLIGAIISLESSGGVSKTAKNAMEVQFKAHHDEIKRIYNFVDNKYEKIVLTNDIDNPLYKDCLRITEEDLNNKHTAISVGTALLASCAKYENYNIPLAIQEYNLGIGNMEKVLINAREGLGYSTSTDMTSDPTNLEYINYTYTINQGDPTYIADVMQYINTYNNGKNDSIITIKSHDDISNKEHSILILPESMK